MQGFDMRNKNLLVQSLDRTITMNNGISFQDTRGKKDLIQGKVVASDKSLHITENTIVIFPKYAADVLELNNENYYIVNYCDIKMMESS